MGLAAWLPNCPIASILEIILELLYRIIIQVYSSDAVAILVFESFLR